MAMKQPIYSSVTHNQPWKWAIIGCVLLSMVAWQLWPRPIRSGMVLPSPQFLSDFALSSTTSDLAHLSDFRGQYLLINFGYTSCPDICPATLLELAEMTELLGKQADKIQVLFISVDSVNDTTERLTTYLSGFHPSFIGLTGSEEDVRLVATQFGIFFQSHTDAYGLTNAVDHTGTVAVVDPNGYLRLVFPSGISGQDLTTDLKNFIK